MRNQVYHGRVKKKRKKKEKTGVLGLCGRLRGHRLDLDPVDVDEVASHRVLAGEDGLADGTDGVAPVYTAVVGEAVAAVVDFTADVAHPAAALVVQRPRAPPHPHLHLLLLLLKLLLLLRLLKLEILARTFAPRFCAHNPKGFPFTHNCFI